MQQTTDLPFHSITPAASAAATRTKAVSRVAYIDAARALLIILVIMIHAAVTYGGTGDWTYIDRTANDELSEIILSFVVIYIQAFSMSAFFLIAGYFTPGSYDRKGPVRFWKDRLIHLALPMLVYTLLLSRIPNYLNAVVNHGLRSSFWEFSRRTFWIDADGGPTWFLFALLVFTIGYTIWRLASGSTASTGSPAKKLLPVPGIPTLMGVALAMGVAMFAVAQFMPLDQAYRVWGAYNVIAAFFPFYITVFIGGLLAYRNDWFSRLPQSQLRFWAWLSLALLVFLPVFFFLTGVMETGLDPYISGLTWRCLVCSLWFGSAAISFSLALILWLRGRVQPASRLTAYASPNTFGVYLLHPIVLVPIAVGLTFVNMHPLIKFTLATAATVLVCYPLVDLLRRLPGFRSVL